MSIVHKSLQKKSEPPRPPVQLPPAAGAEVEADRPTPDAGDATLGLLEEAAFRRAVDALPEQSADPDDAPPVQAERTPAESGVEPRLARLRQREMQLKSAFLSLQHEVRTLKEQLARQEEELATARNETAKLREQAAAADKEHQAVIGRLREDLAAAIGEAQRLRDAMPPLHGYNGPAGSRQSAPSLLSQVRHARRTEEERDREDSP